MKMFRQMIKAVVEPIVPRRLLLIGGPRRDRRVALTFDDGPHPEHTPRLLELLRRLNVKATFFVVGKEVERYPQLVQQMASDGHAVGHHSFFHTEPDSTSAKQLIAEVKRSADLLRELLGARPTLFRPPRGKLTTTKLLGLWQCRQQVVLWNADPRDHAQHHAEPVRRWFHEHPLRGGQVVLLHDRLPHACDVLPEVIDAARSRNPDMAFSTILPWVQ